MSGYLEAARHVEKWLLATAVREPEGWWWPEHPEKEAPVDPSVGWGTGGPAVFMVEMERTAPGGAAREGADQAYSWMRHHLVEMSEFWAGCGLMTGVGGWAVFAEELAAVTGSDGYRELASAVFGQLVEKATPDGAGVHWHGYTEILWGTAGIGCLLLSHGGRYLGDDALVMAARAGDWVLGQATPGDRGGIRWSLGPTYEAEHPGPIKWFPNFAHGAAGIGFFLARLAEVTGEERFAVGARQALEWIMTTVRTDGVTCAAYHHDNGGEELYTLGWCHGPPGLGGFFRQLEITEKDPAWRDWLRKAARADLTSGIPERREPGFWDNVARCCGSAGVAEFFLDLHTLGGGEADLAFARLMVDDILERATTDEGGTRWSNVEYRNADPILPPEPTYLQGASGIGTTL